MGGRGQPQSHTAGIDAVKEKQKKKGLKGLSKLFKRSKKDKDKEHKLGADSDDLSDSEEEMHLAQQQIARTNSAGIVKMPCSLCFSVFIGCFKLYKHRP